MIWFCWSYIKLDKNTILNVSLSFAFPPNRNFEQGGGVYSEALSAVDYFRKTLSLLCLTRFWKHLWVVLHEAYK